MDEHTRGFASRVAHPRLAVHPNAPNPPVATPCSINNYANDNGCADSRRVDKIPDCPGGADWTLSPSTDCTVHHSEPSWLRETGSSDE